VLHAAASQDADLKALWEEISQRRARNMRLLAQDLATTGRLRAGLSLSTVAAVIWSMNSQEFYLLENASMKRHQRSTLSIFE
jgi:S-adenosylmethionine:diacylglycerol 3-amino-3-carboxypropyl transferase